MRLKALEIKGFKSFADKTIINLDNQITGIVGPNGCGKSNIVDAIRWVIGEHKIKTLRSDNLEDLIFNGSKSRNGSGLAEVSLTFENTKNLLPTDFNTVTISRKFYKNGESEYRLNDVTCRLKDITNLFLDTGVTSDSYSIIELGMVDDIIKDKDNSRRRMLEQASGISIYKTRKKEAKSKLDATELDLNRIEDLLFEISNNLRSLESQAKKAEKYHAIKSDYKEVSIEFVKASLEDFNDSYQQLNTQQQHNVDAILALETEIATQDAHLENEKLALLKKEEELHQLQKEFNNFLEKIRNTEHDKNLSSQKIEHLNQLSNTNQKAIDHDQAQIVLFQKAIQDANEKIKHEENELVALTKRVEELRIHLDEKRKEFDTQKNELDSLRNEHQKIQIEHFDAEKTIAVSQSNINNIKRSIVQLDDDAKAQYQEIEKQKEIHENYQKQVDEKKSILQERIIKQEEATEKLLNSQAILETHRNELIAENRKFDAKQNEYNLLKSLIENLEGYPDSIKFLSKHSEWKYGTTLLSELFTVKEEYRKCIEGYLDKYLNYYVVDTPEQAYHAISLLQNSQKGKAGFFILSEINQKEKSNFEAEEIAALDVLKTDEKYYPLLQYLLHNVCITNDIQHHTNPKHVYLQQDASSYKTGKRIVGGSVGVFEGNKIGRTQRLEILQKEINAIKERVHSFEEKIKNTQNDIIGFNQEIKNEEIETLKNQIAKEENLIIQCLHKIETISQRKEQTELRTKQLNEQLQTAQLAIDEIVSLHQDKNTQMTLAFDNMQSSQAKYALIEGEYNKANEEYNQHNIVVTRQHSKINELKNETTIRSNQIADLQQKVQQLFQEKENTINQIGLTQTAFQDLENLLFEILKEKEVKEKSLNEKDQAFYNFRNELATKESTLNQKKKEKQQNESQLTTIKDKLSEMKLHLASMKERLFVEFKVDLDDVLKNPRVGEQSIEELNIEVEKLKKRIDNLGEVNPMAVEAYKEIKARYEFIQEQKADLVNAKESLLKTIEEVELTANQKFLETFEKVKENFINVFHALFTEDDTCDMRLVDPENLAETAIEIYAQPKGKKPSTITQLSGGEKTLTSAAFLFAIYLIKPAPFCVLDEVDAPLDDANVGKFTNMIRRFSDNSQFIIVTHNKQTMASVDVIYGVTMQEAGVSKLVPVDFRSLN
ncbi:MAG: chromosome segregation protein SMC [Chitinophagaceae bacterium]